MILAKYFLIALFTTHGPHTSVVTLGEFDGIAACQNAAKIVYQEADKLNGVFSERPRLICAAKVFNG